MAKLVLWASLLGLLAAVCASCSGSSRASSADAAACPGSNGCGMPPYVFDFAGTPCCPGDSCTGEDGFVHCVDGRFVFMSNGVEAGNPDAEIDAGVTDGGSDGSSGSDAHDGSSAIDGKVPDGSSDVASVADATAG